MRALYGLWKKDRQARIRAVTRAKEGFLLLFSMAASSLRVGWNKQEQNPFFVIYDWKGTDHTIRLCVMCSKQAFLGLLRPTCMSRQHGGISREKRSPVNLMNHHHHTTLESSLVLFSKGVHKEELL